MTNYDWIHALSHEGLAEFLNDIASGCVVLGTNDYVDCDPDIACKDCIYKWLKEELGGVQK